MSKLTKSNKLSIFLETIKNHNITAYEIGKNTNISTFAVQKIIKGETKKPNERTLDTLLEFLETAIVGTDVKENIVNDAPEFYQKKSISELERCLREQVDLHKRINYLESTLTKNNVDFKSDE